VAIDVVPGPKIVGDFFHDNGFMKLFSLRLSLIQVIEPPSTISGYYLPSLHLSTPLVILHRFGLRNVKHVRRGKQPAMTSLCVFHLCITFDHKVGVHGFWLGF
jgi:hypothetical protein